MSVKITVITVCYNSAQTVAATLGSLTSQRNRNFEHLVADGGSTDGTLEIIKSWNGHPIKIISESDEGIYDAMNKGIEKATGDVIAFLNADDYYKGADVLSVVADTMNDERLDALYGDVEFFRSGQSGTVARRYNSGRFNANRLGWGWMPAHPALFVRKELFDHYGGFRTDYKIAGDFEFIARIFKNRELNHRHLPISLVCMQMGGISTSGWRATLQLNKEMMRACRINAIPTNWLKLLMRYPAKSLEFFRTSN